MSCLLCSSTKYTINTECHHTVCLECFIALKEPKCPKCNEALLDLPNKIVTCISNNLTSVSPYDSSRDMDASDFL